MAVMEDARDGVGLKVTLTVGDREAEAQYVALAHKVAVWEGEGEEPSCEEGVAAEEGERVKLVLKLRLGEMLLVPEGEGGTS